MPRLDFENFSIARHSLTWLERDTMIGGDGADTFVMGSHSFGAFYAKGTGPDFATIQDFSRGEGDKIRVHSTDLYSIDHIGRNSYLYYGNDFVASVPDSNLSMADLIV